MGKTMTKTCDVSGITTSSKNFYSKQTHIKPIDNLRRTSGATKEQMRRMFNQVNTVR